IRKMLNDRNVDFPLDELIKLDKSRRDLIIKTDELRKKRNEISIEIAKRKKANQDTTSLIEQMQETSQILTDLEIEQTQTESNYTPVQTPYLINHSSMEGAIIAQDFEDVIYKIEGDDLYLIGTSEHAVVSMHSDEILEGKILPLRYAGLSSCFRKEAGAHGRD